MTASLPNRLDLLEAALRAAVEQRTPAWLQAQLQAGVFVYGAGGFGRRVVKRLQELGHSCMGIIDRQATPGAPPVEGVPLLHPDDLTPELCANRALVLGVFNPYHDFGEIVRAMRVQGFAEILWGADLPDALGATFNDFWLSGRRFLLDHIAPLRAAYELMADDASRQAFESVVRSRALDGDVVEPRPDLRTQYYPPDLPGFEGPISFLDGGAYDGDTFRNLRDFGVTISNWFAFEPDPQNFARLEAFAETCGVPAYASPCGIARHASLLRFSSTGETNARIIGDAEPGITIQCVAIDEALFNMPIDYVKLDIEGAEADALEGMRKMVTKYRPRLAISAYHRPQDLWAIPLQLSSLLGDAKIYLRQHAVNGFELVAYAIPPGR